jgi:O-antigen/teichoic acid export membrane protein
MQLAHGWTSLTTRINIASVVILVPAIIWVTPRFGAEGAAWLWVILNAGYVLIGIHLMYRKIIKTERWRWYIYDIFYPLLGASAGALLCKWIFPVSDNPIIIFIVLVTSFISSFLVALFLSREIRNSIRLFVMSRHRNQVI